VNIEDKHINNFDSKREEEGEEEKEELKHQETEVPLVDDDLEDP
jgi:hypothetical protein